MKSVLNNYNLELTKVIDIIDKIIPKMLEFSEREKWIKSFLVRKTNDEMLKYVTILHIFFVF